MPFFRKILGGGVDMEMAKEFIYIKKQGVSCPFFQRQAAPFLLLKSGVNPYE